MSMVFRTIIKTNVPWEELGCTPEEWITPIAKKFVYSKKTILEIASKYHYLDARNHSDQGVYFLIKDGEIVYVGSAESGIYNRLVHHEFYKMQEWDSWMAIGGIPERFLRPIEAFYIRKFNPALNQRTPKTTEFCDIYKKVMKR